MKVDGNKDSNNKGHSLSARIFSVLAVLLILFLIGWLIYCIVTKSEHTAGVLFLVIICPMFIYIFLWLKKVFDK